MLTGSDKIATIVYSAAAELNLTVGRDLAVVGFDGNASGDLLHPPLTSIVIPFEDIARRVIDGLSGRSTMARIASRERSSRLCCARDLASRRTQARNGSVP